MPVRGKKIYLTLFLQIIPVSCQNIIEDSGVMLFLFTSVVISLLTSFLENKCNVLTKTSDSLCFAFQHLMQPFLLFPHHPLPLFPSRFHQRHNRCSPPRQYSRLSPQGGAGEGWWMRIRTRGGGNFWNGTGQPPPAADRRGRSG